MSRHIAAQRLNSKGAKIIRIRIIGRRLCYMNKYKEIYFYVYALETAQKYFPQRI